MHSFWISFAAQYSALARNIIRNFSFTAQPKDVTINLQPLTKSYKGGSKYYVM